jgi:hypothetical protein
MIGTAASVPRSACVRARKGGLLRAFLSLVLLTSTPFSIAADTQLISVNAGENRDVYFEINLSGKVSLAIYAPNGGEACADFWWIEWPLGNTESLGRQCTNATFDIPGLSKFAISAKLRVGGARQPLKVVAGANQEVAHSVTVGFP